MNITRQIFTKTSLSNSVRTIYFIPAKINYTNEKLENNVELKQNVRLLHILPTSFRQSVRYSSDRKDGIEPEARKERNDNDVKEESKALTTKEKLKKAVKEYGATVVVFHVGISLISLGGCYVLVSSGVDLEAFLKFIGLGDSFVSSKLINTSGTFVVAYAVHKVFAPVRLSITFAATPFIVRYLRNIGILKKPYIK